MQTLWLIFKREYWTRVRRRAFLLATFLTPLGIAAFIAIATLIFTYQGDDLRRIAVLDEAQILNRALPDSDNLSFQFVDLDLELMLEIYDSLSYNGILVVPPLSDVMNQRHRVYYYSDDVPSLDLEIIIRDRLSERLRDYKIEQLGFEREALQALNTRIDIQPRRITDKESKVSSLTGAIGAGIGFLMGMVMYMTVFIYGMMVMRSVMEEKTNRIVEVMISAVKPYQLMLGKITGVGAVGLTQVAIWVVLIPLLVFLVQLIFGIESDGFAPQNSLANDQINPEDAEAMMALALAEFKNQNWLLMLILFVCYFLGGYFLYSSLFAAVGSAMGDDLGEGQALTLPISIPVILALYIMIATIQSPNSSLAIFSSIFPLFSPIVMPARLPFSPPVWEVILSLVVLIATAVFFVWLSARIYRVGILMYGKKVGFRTLAKWFFYRD